MGITVFVDLMFACSSMNPDDAMMENIRIEAEQNLARLRHHPSIVIISGNNEIELWCTWQPVKYPRYLEVFEDRLPMLQTAFAPTYPMCLRRLRLSVILWTRKIKISATVIITAYGADSLLPNTEIIIGAI